MARGVYLLSVFASERVRLMAEAARITGDAAAAEDVVQDAWLRLARSATSLRINDSKRFVWRVVRNLALDEYRQRRRRDRATLSDDLGDSRVAPSDMIDAERIMIATEELALVGAELERMPPRMRRAVELHRLSGATLREISVELGVSITTAHSLVIDGVERCRRSVRRAPN